MRPLYCGKAWCPRCGPSLLRRIRDRLTPLPWTHALHLHLPTLLQYAAPHLADRAAGVIWTTFLRRLCARLPGLLFFRMLRWMRNRDQVHCHALLCSPDAPVTHVLVRDLWAASGGGGDVCVRAVYSAGAAVYAAVGRGGARYEQAPAHDPPKYFRQFSASRGILSGVTRAYTPCLEDRCPQPPKREGWTFCHMTARRALAPPEFPF